MIDEIIEQTVKETKEEKWVRECLEQGFKYLGKSSENSRYTIAECLTCQHVDSYNSSHMRKGNVRCSKCIETKHSNECLAQGFKLISKSLENSRYTIAECLTCHHVDSYTQDNIRKGYVRCSKCLETKYSNECLAQGFKYLGKSSENSKCSIAECLTCTHVDSYDSGAMRDGRVRCNQCLVNKYKSLVKPDWQYIDKTVIKNNSHVILKHHCSDNLVTVHSSHFLKGSYDCPHCSQTHFDNPSYFYTIRITHNNQTLVKIGISNNPYQRFTQYGLPESATLEIIHVKPFPSKRLAIAFESMMKESLKDFKIPEDTSKNIFTIQGHTETFSAESLNTINQII